MVGFALDEAGHAGGRLGCEGWRFHSRSARSQKVAESRGLRPGGSDSVSQSPTVRHAHSVVQQTAETKTSMW